MSIKLNVGRSEFYDKAVSLGFYGNDESGLTGKKDNVRKFWEEMSMKVYCRGLVEKIVKGGKKISILDLGSGSGEGYKLLTQIPPADPKDSVENDFLLTKSGIKEYLGIEVNKAMAEQGRLNYKRYPNVKFKVADLSEGLPNIVLDHEPYDLYFSSFSSLSHLDQNQLEKLLSQIFTHARKGSVMYFDLLGKYSPEWPKYWNKKDEMLPYTMSHLIPDTKWKKENLEWFLTSYWSPEKLKKTIQSAAESSGRKIKISFMSDRSVFVGRHMDTGLMSGKRIPVRYQVNRLFDYGFRGQIKHLELDMMYLKDLIPSNPEVWKRLFDYQIKWNRVIYILGALYNHKDEKIKRFIEEADIAHMSDDLKFLVWLFRNSDRFPVADFWSSVLGPQVAVVLRNIEMSYTEAVGCGHSLMCGLEVVG
jgi:SAM-dependent methyltransferase